MTLRVVPGSSSKETDAGQAFKRDPSSDDSLKALMAIPSPTQSSSDSESDEEEVFTLLDEAALAQLPMPLQKTMRDIQAERYERLSEANPQLKVRGADFWRKQDETFPQNVPAKKSSELPGPTSLQPRAKDHPNPQSAFTSSLEDKNTARQGCDMHNGINGNAFAQQRLFTENRRSLDTARDRQTNPSRKMLISAPVPGSFRHLNRDHLSAPWETDKEKAPYGGSIVHGRPSKSIGCSMRARVKKSMQRLNKLIRNPSG
ncbi:hypothetical protein VTN31DRAFT_1253 [Thermomyces dupontii]|uniref:uncharacterized protein n=1 Tax=Talaromyces thermophilus TaxID=28565 RepID=UPI0037428EA7